MASPAVSPTTYEGITPLGGIPLRGHDLAASLVLVVAFAALLPIAVLRVLRPEPNQLRPFILIQTQLVAFVIRVVQAKGRYSNSLFLAEQFLLLTGFLLLSLLFLLAYTCAFPILLLRLKSRSMAVLCPFVFVQARVATFIIRAIQSAGDYSAGLFVAEQILLITGFVILCEPLVTLTYHHVVRALKPNSPRALWLYRGAVLLQLALVASVVLGIPAGAQFNNLSSSSSTLATIKACRSANGAICLAVVVLVQVVLCVAYCTLALPVRQTAYLFLVSWLLIVTSVYKNALDATGLHLDVAGPATKATFYLVTALPELIVVSLYLFLNVKEEFGITEAVADGKAARRVPEPIHTDLCEANELRAELVLDIAKTPVSARAPTPLSARFPFVTVEL